MDVKLAMVYVLELIVWCVSELLGSFYQVRSLNCL